MKKIILSLVGLLAISSVNTVFAGNCTVGVTNCGNGKICAGESGKNKGTCQTFDPGSNGG